MKKKRVNPHRRPATLADVQKAKKAAQNEAVTTAWAIFFSALRDKEGFGYTRLRRVWDETTSRTAFPRAMCRSPISKRNSKTMESR